MVFTGQGILTGAMTTAAAFIAMWEAMGGRARYERRHAWFERHRERFLDALG